jgi:hypothetical protein
MSFTRKQMVTFGTGRRSENLKFFHCRRCSKFTCASPNRHRLVCSLVRDMLKENPELDLDRLVNRKTGTALDHRRAIKERNNFLETALSHLVQLETRHFGKKPSIAYFCRIDFSILEDEETELHYFINEVDRTHTCCLWSGQNDSHRAGIVGDEFSTQFLEWLSHNS